MVYPLQLAPAARADDARAALGRIAAEEVALVFPPGLACALADPAELARLREHCRTLGKRVLVVGGDAALRAGAVAAGFAAATALDAWEATGRHRAARLPRLAFGWHRGRPGARSAPAADPPPDLWLVPALSAPGDASPGGAADDAADDAVGDDPPGYVADLMGGEPRRHSAVPTIPLVPSRGEGAQASRRRDQAQAERLERDLQRHEERVIATIRGSGASPAAELAGDACAAMGEAE